MQVTAVCNTHTHTRRHLTLAPVQEHMSLLTPLRITVINQTPRCRWNLPNADMHKHTHTHTCSRRAGSRTQPRNSCSLSAGRHRVAVSRCFFFFFLVNKCQKHRSVKCSAQNLTVYKYISLLFPCVCVVDLTLRSSSLRGHV